MENDTETRPSPLMAWLELQAARGVTMRSIAAQLELPESVLSSIRHGKRRLPRNRLQLAKTVTSLGVEELLA